MVQLLILVSNIHIYYFAALLAFFTTHITRTFHLINKKNGRAARLTARPNSLLS